MDLELDPCVGDQGDGLTRYVDTECILCASLFTSFHDAKSISMVFTVPNRHSELRVVVFDDGSEDRTLASTTLITTSCTHAWGTILPLGSTLVLLDVCEAVAHFFPFLVARASTIIIPHLSNPQFALRCPECPETARFIVRRGAKPRVEVSP